jgi:hypothetical protein
MVDEMELMILQPHESNDLRHTMGDLNTFECVLISEKITEMLTTQQQTNLLIETRNIILNTEINEHKFLLFLFYKSHSGTHIILCNIIKIITMLLSPDRYQQLHKCIL